MSLEHLVLVPFAEPRGIARRVCTKCGEARPLAEFAKDRRKGDGWRSACKVCNSEYNADPEVKVRRAAYDAERRAKNTERNRGRVQDSSKTKRCGGKCGRTLPETAFALHLCEADGLQRRCRDCDTSAYRKSCRSTHGDPVGQSCYLCGETIARETDAHADHLIPQSLGGGDHGYNMRWTHARCNVSRGNALTTIEQYWRLHPDIAAACGLVA